MGILQDSILKNIQKQATQPKPSSTPLTDNAVNIIKQATTQPIPKQTIPLPPPIKQSAQTQTQERTGSVGQGKMQRIIEPQKEFSITKSIAQMQEGIKQAKIDNDKHTRDLMLQLQKTTIGRNVKNIIETKYEKDNLLAKLISKQPMSLEDAQKAQEYGIEKGIIKPISDLPLTKFEMSGEQAFREEIAKIYGEDVAKKSDIMIYQRNLRCRKKS